MSRERVKIDEDKRFKEKSKANKRKLDDRTIDALKPSDRQFLVWDEKQAGLCLLVSPGGTKSWRSNFTIKGKGAASRSLGRYPALGLADARKRCLSDLAKAQDGIDPRPEKVKAAKGLTVSELVAEYVRTYATHNQKTADQTEACLRRHLADVWDRPANDIDADILQPKIDRLVAQGKNGSAKQAKAWLCALWRWAYKRRKINQQVADQLVIEVGQSSPRRSFTEQELRTIWHSGDELRHDERCYIRLLLLMGLRFTELARARWDEFKFDSEGRAILFTVSSDRTKTKKSSRPREYKIPVTSQMQTILSELQSEAESDWLFRIQHQCLMVRIRKVSGIDDFSFHKLRNTLGEVFETEFGYGKYEIGIVLNHAVDAGGATGNYMPSQHLKRKRELLDVWNSYVFDLVGIEQPEGKPALAAVG